MRIILYVIFLLITGITFELRAQLTTVYSNSFETVGSESILKDSYVGNNPSYGNHNWAFARSTDLAASGTSSVKVTMPTTLGYTCYGQWTHSDPLATINPAKQYAVRVKIFIPISSNFNDDTSIFIRAYSVKSLICQNEPGYYTDNLKGCPVNVASQSFAGKLYGPMSANKGRWIQLYTALDRQTQLTEPKPLQFSIYVTNGQGVQTHFYIDDLEILEYTPLTINDNEIINGGNIHLNPSGGLSELPYTAEWFDLANGLNETPDFKGLNRYGLPAGTYKVRIGHEEYTCMYQFFYTTFTVIPLCQTNLPVTITGTVKLDKHSGQVVFEKGDNCNVPIDLGCIEGKVETPQITNVVAASATTYSDLWDLDFTGKVFADTLLYEHGERGKWRPSAAFAYNTPVNYQVNERNMIAGRYSLPKFNWRYPTPNARTGWLQTSSIDKYSPHGEPVEERNALKIYSTAKLGYGESVPYLVAQNAEYVSVMFESFENKYGNVFEDGVVETGGFSTGAQAHSGKKSFTLTGQLISRVIAANGKKIQIRFWAMGFTALTNMSITATSGAPTALKKIAQSGKWTLLESTLTAVGNTTIRINKVSGSASIYVDDVRIQPADAEMTCYVYDVRTLKLLTTFDNQHFGLYYQYNDEGKLIRKQIETERGIKTIEETQYNSPQTNKVP